MSEETFAERVARLKREREAKTGAATPPPPPPAVEHDADLIPEVEEYKRDDVDIQIDRLIDGIDILDAYRRWCGKMEPNPGKKRESVMISCPNPNHPDANPSAWINLDEDLWFCGGCQEGGDKFDIAAWHFGYDVPGYKEGKNFVDLRTEMAEDLGYVVRKTMSGERYIELATEVESDSEMGSLPPSDHETPDQSTDVKSPSEGESAGEEPPDDDDPKGSPLTIVPALDETDEATAPVSQSDSSPPSVIHFPSPDEMYGPSVPPSIDWANMVPEDTFLYKWMDILEHDDLPEEFYFWHGGTMIGVAAGRDAFLADRNPVYGNLFTCLYGHTGQGKSRATNHMLHALRNALPHDTEEEYNTGTYLVPMPGSSEALIDAFSRPIEDPADDTKKIYCPVRGLVYFDELATLVGRASRSGNPMKQTFMGFYDMRDRIDTASRGSGIVIADKPFCSTVSTTQPKAIRDVLIASDVDSGFVNRWIYVMGRSKATIPFGGPNLDTEPTWDDLRAIRTWASSGRSIGMTDEAVNLWNEFYFDQIDPMKRSPEMAMLARIDLTLKKFMLLLAINAHRVVIDKPIVQKAIEMFDYLHACYMMLSGDLGAGLTNEMDKAIIAGIEAFHAKAGIWPSAREIYQRLGRQLRGDSGLFHRQLKILTDIGVITVTSVKPARGRPTDRYSYDATGSA